MRAARERWPVSAVLAREMLARNMLASTISLSLLVPPSGAAERDACRATPRGVAALPVQHGECGRKTHAGNDPQREQSGAWQVPGETVVLVPQVMRSRRG